MMLNNHLLNVINLHLPSYIIVQQSFITCDKSKHYKLFYFFAHD